MRLPVITTDEETPTASSPSPSALTTFGSSLLSGRIPMKKVASSLMASFSSAARHRIANVVSAARRFIINPEAQAILLSASVYALNTRRSPSLVRIHVLALIAMETDFRSRVSGGGSAKGYFQMLEGSTGPMLQREGLKYRDRFQIALSTFPRFANAITRTYGMLMRYFEKIDTHWRYSEQSGWTPNSNTGRNAELLRRFPSTLAKREAGEHLLLVAVHINYSAFSLSSRDLPHSDTRYLPDVATFEKLRADTPQLNEQFMQNLPSNVIRSLSQGKLTGDASTTLLPPGRKEVRITSRFSKRRSQNLAAGIIATRPHKGIDIAAASGTPLFAPISGKITDVYRKRGIGTWGDSILLTTASGTSYRFAHLSKIYVTLGESVKQGQLIAASGASGALHPHLHFEYTPAHSREQADPLEDPDQAYKKVFGS